MREGPRFELHCMQHFLDGISNGIEHATPPIHIKKNWLKLFCDRENHAVDIKRPSFLVESLYRVPSRSIYHLSMFMTVLRMRGFGSNPMRA